MKYLLPLAALSALVAYPFVKLKRSWAVRWWRRIRLVFIAYALTIFLIAAFEFVEKFHAIYG